MSGRTIEVQPVPSAPFLAGELLVLTIVASYAIKYVEPVSSLPFEPNALVGWALVVGIPSIVAFRFAKGGAPAASA